MGLSKGCHIPLCYWLGSKASSVAQTVKNLPANAGDLGSNPEFRRSPGGGNSNPLQDSCLKNPMDRGAWRVHEVAESDTMERLSIEWLENT